MSEPSVNVVPVPNLPHQEVIDSIDIPDVEPDRMMVPNSSGKDLSTQIQFRTLTAIVRNVEVLLDSRKFPQYQTKSDIHRAAHYIGLRALLQAASMPTTISSMEVAIKTLMDDEINSRQLDLVQRLDQMVARHTAAGDGAGYAHAAKLLLQVQAVAAGIPDDYWRGRMLGMLKSRFGGFMQVAGQYMNGEVGTPMGPANALANIIGGDGE